MLEIVIEASYEYERQLGMTVFHVFVAVEEHFGRFIDRFVCVKFCFDDVYTG
jgi:hypothetical protein